MSEGPPKKKITLLRRPVTLEYLADNVSDWVEQTRAETRALTEQLRRVLNEQRTMHDEMLVQCAIIRRLDSTQSALLDEMRAIHALLAPVVDRVRALEEKG